MICWNDIIEELEDVPHGDEKMQRTVENDKHLFYIYNPHIHLKLTDQRSQGQKQCLSGFRALERTNTVSFRRLHTGC